MTATSAVAHKRTEEFGQWKAVLIKANPGARIKIVRVGVQPSMLISASEPA